MRLFKRLQTWLTPVPPATPSHNLEDLAELAAPEETGISSALAEELRNGAELCSHLAHIREETEHLSQWVHQHAHDWTLRQAELKAQLNSYEKELDNALSAFQAMEQRLGHPCSETDLLSSEDKLS